MSTKPKTRKPKTGRTALIGVRVKPAYRTRLMKLAKRKGVTLGALIEQAVDVIEAQTV